MKLNFLDIKHQLHVNVNVEFEFCPAGGYEDNLTSQFENIDLLTPYQL